MAHPRLCSELLIHFKIDFPIIISVYYYTVGPNSTVGIVTRYGWTVLGSIFCTRPDRPWGPPSLLHYGHRVFPGCTAAGA